MPAPPPNMSSIRPVRAAGPLQRLLDAGAAWSQHLRPELGCAVREGLRHGRRGAPKGARHPRAHPEGDPLALGIRAGGARRWRSPGRACRGGAPPLAPDAARRCGRFWAARPRRRAVHAAAWRSLPPENLRTKLESAQRTFSVITSDPCLQASLGAAWGPVRQAPPAGRQVYTPPAAPRGRGGQDGARDRASRGGRVRGDRTRRVA